MLVSDLDGTLLGHDDALERFSNWWQRRRPALRLVYTSGRSYASVLNSLTSSLSPRPDAIISSVGTNVRLFPSGLPLLDWSARWWASWNASRVHRILAEFHELQPQSAENQTEFKVSYYLHGGSPATIARIRGKLAEARIHAELIYSHGSCLDIVPAGMNKGGAAEFLARRWEIPREQVLACGDSGNDSSLFLQGFRSIVVSNAQPELASLRLPTIYFARGSHADGVLEGLAHWLATTPGRELVGAAS
jgi:mannosylfructose-6-phosphate phosphatase